MNSKKEPQDCEVDLCCKATAELKLEISKELEQDDKALGVLLKPKEKEPDENQDTA